MTETAQTKLAIYGDAFEALGYLSEMGRKIDRDMANDKTAVIRAALSMANEDALKSMMGVT